MKKLKLLLFLGAGFVAFIMVAHFVTTAQTTIEETTVDEAFFANQNNIDAENITTWLEDTRVDIVANENTEATISGDALNTNESRSQLQQLHKDKFAIDNGARVGIIEMEVITQAKTMEAANNTQESDYTAAYMNCLEVSGAGDTFDSTANITSHTVITTDAGTEIKINVNVEA